MVITYHWLYAGRGLAKTVLNTNSNPRRRFPLRATTLSLRPHLDITLRCHVDKIIDPWSPVPAVPIVLNKSNALDSQNSSLEARSLTKSEVLDAVLQLDADATGKRLLPAEISYISVSIIRLLGLCLG